MFNNYIQGARKRKLNFSLTLEQFIILIQQNCCYCGDSPAFVRRHPSHKNEFILYNGIDREDNQKDYTLDNCVTCCNFCNTAKLHHSTEFFLEKIKKIYNKHYGNT